MENLLIYIQVIYFISFMLIGVNATIVFTLDKWGFFDWYVDSWHKFPRFFSWLPEHGLCVYCLGFWLSVIQCIIMYKTIAIGLYIFIIPFVVLSYFWVLINLFKK